MVTVRRCSISRRRIRDIPDRSVVNLIYAPGGRDAQIASSLLTEAGFASIPVRDLDDLATKIGDGTGFVVITEEAVRSADLKAVADWVRSQASWSDMPFIVLTHRGGGPERNPAAARLSEVLGNVSFVERPFHATTFISVARTAMRGRRRQFEARVRIEELDEGERKLATALSAGHLGTWEFDIATGALTTSPTCRAVFGRKPNEAFSYEDLRETIHPDDRSRMEQAVSATIKTGVDYAIEYRTIWPDGTHHWAEIRAQLHRSRDGRAVKMVGVSADITARRTDEERQRQLNELLEERVALRTAELQAAHAEVLAEVAQREKAEEQLRQSQKLEAIGQLTGGIAHDFNNLLMAVLGNLELIRKAVNSDARLVRLADGALQGARRGASLTQRLLAFARRQDLQVNPVDIRNLVSGMEDLLTRSVGPEIVLEISLPADLPLVLADANQVELALLNLAVNSRDAMPNGGKLSIAIDEREIAVDGGNLQAGRYAVLTVTDTGNGMDEETLKKAVEPFFSTKELGKGTGLGLSMIHGLALQLSGQFLLKSQLGVGTTAELWVPVVDTSYVTAVDSSAVAVSGSTAVGLKRILLVDDDVLIAMSSADMIADLGHEVVEAHSGAEALDIIRQDGQIDLMITDYSMPGMNGAELIGAVRQIRPDLPLLLATGYADLPSGVQVEATRLAKPYTQDQLATEIGKSLASRSL